MGGEVDTITIVVPYLSGFFLIKGFAIKGFAVFILHLFFIRIVRLRKFFERVRCYVGLEQPRNSNGCIHLSVFEASIAGAFENPGDAPLKQKIFMNCGQFSVDSNTGEKTGVGILANQIDGVGHFVNGERGFPWDTYNRNLKFTHGTTTFKATRNGA